MIYWFKRKFWQIKNLFKWIPIIWNQFDFDYQYSIEVFKFQLQKQAEFLESNKAYTVEAENNAKRIRTVLKLMDKVYNEEYACEYQDKLKELYGDNVLDFKFIEVDSKNNGDKIYSIQYECETWVNYDEIEKTKDTLFKISKEKQERAHKLLWCMIEKDIRKWWD